MAAAVKHKGRKNSRLNRFVAREAEEKHLHKVRDQEDTPAKLRPHLSSLHTVDDIKKWIPSIGREINYFLKQLEGVDSREYRDTKIEEFEERVQFLEKEHKRFIAKIQSLDPSQTDIPWKPRSYSSKRPHRTSEVLPQAKRLVSPLVNDLEDSQASPMNKPIRHTTSSTITTVPSNTGTTHTNTPATTIPGMANYSSSSEESTD